MWRRRAGWKRMMLLAAAIPAIAAAEPYACLLGPEFGSCVTEMQPLFDFAAERARRQSPARAINHISLGGNGRLYLSAGKRFEPPYLILDRNGERPSPFFPPATLASAFLVPQACFHAREESAGPTQCREPGRRLMLPAGMSAGITSISIPYGLRVRASARATGRDSAIFGPPSAGLTASEQRTLRWFDVARTKIGCTERCPIGETDSYAVDEIYGELWRNAFFDNKAYQFTFSIGRLSRLDVAHTGRFPAYFRLDRGTLGISHAASLHVTRRQWVLAPGTRALTLAFEREGDRALRYQILELDRNRQLLRASPLAELFNGDRPDGKPAETVTILSRSPDIRLDSLSFAVGTGPKRAYRSYGLALCYANPLLAIFNYVVQGRCNQPEAIYRYAKGEMPPRNAMLLHVAGKFPPLGRSDHVQAHIPSFSKVRELFTGSGDPYLMHGVARACGTTVERMLMPRLIMRRGIDGDPLTCAYWTLDILTAFTRLYGPHWDLAFFNRIIDRIIQHGSLEPHPGMHPAEAEELVRRVQDLRNVQHDRLSPLRHAYASASALYYSSSFGTLMPDGLPPDNVDALFPPIAADAAAPAAIGHYELDVTRFTPRPGFPRVWQNGGWNDAAADFRVAIFDQRSQRDPAFRSTIQTLEGWLAVYGAAGSAPSSSSESDSEAEGVVGGAAPPRLAVPLARWGSALASNLLLEMRAALPPGSAVVVVYYQDRLVTVALGSMTGGRANVDNILSSPASVLQPHTAESVRGGGQRALTEFIRLCMARGVQTITAHAVSPPSASLHAGLGFRLQEDL